jgi:hypothetical protein
MALLLESLSIMILIIEERSSRLEASGRAG